jgi:hypothetical protein
MATETYCNTFNVTLASPTTNGTTILVTQAAPIDGGFRILIDTELMQVTSGGTTTSWNVTRNIEGTTLTSHSTGTPIVVVLTAGALAAILPVNSVGVHAALPVSGMKTGDTYQTTDGGYRFIYNGTSWQAFFMNQSVIVPPNMSGWTWRNQGSATADDNHGFIHMYSPAIGVADSMTILERPTPSSPVDFGFMSDACQESYHYFGVGLIDSGTGKLVNCQWTYEGSIKYYVRSWNSPTSYNGLYGSDGMPYFGSFMWMRIVDDGTYRKFYRSSDGLNWMLMGPSSTSRTDWITPNKIGWFASPTNGTLGMNVNLISYQEH